MPLSLDDTIAAIASPPGPAPRGIVRLSGPNVAAVVHGVFHGRMDPCRLPSRFTGIVNVGPPGVPLPLKSDLLLWPTARSYTGQPMAEFHTIGAPPLLDSLLEILCAHGARQAERGEFTLRAFLNGRLDLLQAEAVLGVIDAADHQELQQALTQLGGGLTSRLQQVRSDIIALLGDLEAGLDFVDEDIEFVTADELIRRLKDAANVFTDLLRDSRKQLPSGYRPRVVLAGLPNAGKSTLFNRLAGDSLAIESTQAGTTRDYLTAPVPLGELKIELIDTAGYEAAGDALMQQAQLFRSEQFETADLIIWCTAADLPAPLVPGNSQLQADLSAAGGTVIPILTCADRTSPGQDDALPVSAVTGQGIEALKNRLRSALSRTSSARVALLSTTSVRCRDSLRRALNCAQSAVESLEQQAGDEITAVELRDVLKELRSILGETCTDEILDHIFSSFCIGK